MRGRDGVIRAHAYTDEQEEGRPPIFLVSPGMLRERAERYRGVYTSLGFSVTAYKDGTLEPTWKAGKGVSEVCASPRCTA